jgi:tetratricopeptide (TPR) repeat protein
MKTSVTNLLRDPISVILVLAIGLSASALYTSRMFNTPLFTIQLNHFAEPASVSRAETVLADYDAAVTANPQSATAYFDRCVALNGLERHRDAAADCTLALQLDPALAQAFVQRGDAYHAIGRFDEALADYDRALYLLGGDSVLSARRDILLQRMNPGVASVTGEAAPTGAVFH